MPQTEWTVFFGQKDAGNLKPVTGWAEKELKVAKVSDGSVKEKNKPAPLKEAGSIKTAEPQQCYFVSVLAEGAEEACLVVDRFLSQGLANSTLAATMETAGGGGPSIKAFLGSSGKMFAATSANIEEVTVK